MSESDRQKLALHAGQRYTEEEAEKLRELGYVLVQHLKISETRPMYIVSRYEGPP